MLRLLVSEDTGSRGIMDIQCLMALIRGVSKTWGKLLARLGLIGLADV
jgi:hypothetical protein